ncbi:hypothetical protein QCA50_012577 [Cerrena zonata]|uniref:DUF6589 domain-containing protein n=1 Tax=Cerrena zonata TaxID=2478898 RepID=A0AAW0FT78_9APHY
MSTEGSDTSSDNDDGIFQGDWALANSILLMRDGLLFLEACSAVASGDIGRVWEVLKILTFAGAGNSNYTSYLLEMFCKIHYELPKSTRDALFNNWLVNLAGKPGHFLPLDLMQEHFNPWLEELAQHKGKEFDDEWYREVLSMHVYDFLRLKEEMENIVEIKPRTKRHAEPHLDNELREAMRIFREHDLHRHHRGRDLDFQTADSRIKGVSILRDAKIADFLQTSMHWRENLDATVQLDFDHVAEGETYRCQPIHYSNGTRRIPTPTTEHKIIRCYFREIMNRLSPREPFNIDSLPSQYEVSEYTRTNGECCDIDDFKPDLRGKVGSDWNQSIIRVFVSGYLESGWCNENDEDRIALHAENHLNYLIKRFDIKMQTPVYQQALARKRARDERKRLLLLQQLTAAEMSPDLACHIPMLEKLGVNGMSSDEEDQFRGVRHYRVLPKRWRAPNLSPWLRVFDAAYRKERLGPFGQSPGAMPRIRTSTAAQTAGAVAKVVRGLPENAYNRTFLESLTPFERRRLRVSEGNYWFEHASQLWILSQECGGDVIPELG